MSAFLLLVLVDVSIDRQRADEFDELIGNLKDVYPFSYKSVYVKLCKKFKDI